MAAGLEQQLAAAASPLLGKPGSSAARAVKSREVGFFAEKNMAAKTTMVKNCLKKVLVDQYVDKQPEDIITFQRSFEQDSWQDALLHLSAEDVFAIFEIRNDEALELLEDASNLL